MISDLNIKKLFLAQRARKLGQSYLQDLEVGMHSELYLLVNDKNNNNK